MDIDALLQRDEVDLALSIKGMYRILDLISEQGSGGLSEFLTQNRHVSPVLIYRQSIRSSYPKTRLRRS